MADYCCSAATMESAITKAFEEMRATNHGAVKRTTGHFNQNIANLKIDLIKNVDMAKSAGTPDTKAMEERWLKHITSVHEQLAEYASNMHFNIDENIETAKVFMASLVKEEIAKCASTDMVQHIKEMVLAELKDDVKNRDSVQQVKEMVLTELKEDVKDRHSVQQVKKMVLTELEDVKKRDSVHEKRISGLAKEWNLEKSNVITELREQVKRLDGKILERFGQVARQIGTAAHTIEERVLGNAQAECLENSEMLEARDKAIMNKVEELEQKILELEKRSLPASPSGDAIRLYIPATRNMSPFRQITMAPADDGNNLFVEKARKWVVTDLEPNKQFDEASLGTHPALRKKCLEKYLGMPDDGKRSASDSHLVKNSSVSGKTI